MKSDIEYERRFRAIKLLGEGVRDEEVLREVQPGRFWLSKWTRRNKVSGMGGLRDQSRALNHSRNKTREPLVRRHLPDDFSLERYMDARGRLALPVALGQVSFACKVNGHGSIEFNGAEHFIRRKQERQCVVATLSTHHRKVFIKHEGKLIKSAPFPFKGKVVDPLC